MPVISWRGIRMGVSGVYTVSFAFPSQTVHGPAVMWAEWCLSPDQHADLVEASFVAQKDEMPSGYERASRGVPKDRDRDALRGIT